MFKFEMTVGWLGAGSVKIETNDFDVIESIKSFIEFQEDNGWNGVWEEAEFDDEMEDDEEDEDGDDDTESEEETTAAK